MRLLLLTAMIACDPVPAECPAMCVTAAESLGPCLEERGLSFESYGYSDAADFQDACETWAWEQGRMGAKASPAQGGGRQARDTLAARCEALEQTFTSGTCDEQLGVDWSNPAWK